MFVLTLKTLWRLSARPLSKRNHTIATKFPALLRRKLDTKASEAEFGRRVVEDVLNGRVSGAELIGRVEQEDSAPHGPWTNDSQERHFLAAVPKTSSKGAHNEEKPMRRTIEDPLFVVNVVVAVVRLLIAWGGCHPSTRLLTLRPGVLVLAARFARRAPAMIVCLAVRFQQIGL